MLEPPLPPDPRVQHWLSRHPGLLSFVLHMVGIPATFLGALFVPIYLGLLSLEVFALALALFVGGFLIQFAGHWLEGTDPGEVIFFKRKLGLPYHEFPRRRAGRRGTDADPDADAAKTADAADQRFGAPAASA